MFGGCHRFHENALRLSRIYWDQPRASHVQAVYWTDYVFRHKVARHVRSAVLDLTWYQYILLDVIILLALAVGSVVLIAFMTLRLVSRRVCGVKSN